MKKLGRVLSMTMGLGVPDSFVNTNILTAGSGTTVANWKISGHFVCKGFQQLC
jgi:hypothetical protein